MHITLSNEGVAMLKKKKETQTRQSMLALSLASPSFLVTLDRGHFNGRAPRIFDGMRVLLSAADLLGRV